MFANMGALDALLAGAGRQVDLVSDFPVSPGFAVLLGVGWVVVFLLMCKR